MEAIPIGMMMWTLSVCNFAATKWRLIFYWACFEIALINGSFNSLLIKFRLSIITTCLINIRINPHIKIPFASILVLI